MESPLSFPIFSTNRDATWQDVWITEVEPLAFAVGLHLATAFCIGRLWALAAQVMILDVFSDRPEVLILHSAVSLSLNALVIGTQFNVFLGKERKAMFCRIILNEDVHERL